MKVPRTALRRVLGLVLFCLGLFVILRWFEQSQVYHPTRGMYASPGEFGLQHEEVSLRAADGVSLHGWFFPSRTNSYRSRIAILYSHGNGGNISHRLDTAALLLETGVNVFLYDYRGYGRSQGRPSEEGTYRDAQAAYQWLISRGFAPENVVSMGESLGGAIATELAVREKVGGLILQSTFTSIPDIGAELFPWLPVRWMARIKYDTASKLPGLTVPVLVMHSPEDDLIGVSHAERNFAAIRAPKQFYKLEGGHNYPLSAVCLAAVESFLAPLEPANGTLRDKVLQSEQAE